MPEPTATDAAEGKAAPDAPSAAGRTGRADGPEAPPEPARADHPEAAATPDAEARAGDEPDVITGTAGPGADDDAPGVGDATDTAQPGTDSEDAFETGPGTGARQDGPDAADADPTAAETPPALAAATAAAHQAAHISVVAAAQHAHNSRAGGAVAPTRDQGTGGSGKRLDARPRPATGSGERLRTAGGWDLVPADAAADRGGVIDGALAGVGPLPSTARKALRRRRIIAFVTFLVLAVIVLVVGHLMSGHNADPAAVGPSASAPAGAPEPRDGIGGATVMRDAGTADAEAPADTAETAAAKAGTPGTFTFVDGHGPVLGTAGTLRPFRVAVEQTIGQGDGHDFAAEVDRILGDPRSWIAGRQVRLQRVPESAGSEFTIYLASADTSEKMCAQGGLKTAGFTSCRLPGQVIINMERWQDAVPDYGAPLETYRAYAINHEVGHQLGHGHEACPGAGEPAPVMMQQTYGLKGCVANSWPYVDGKRYAGPPVA
jgi:hypothetical protein